MGQAASGQYGCVKKVVGADNNAITEIDGWSLNKEAPAHQYATCSSPTDGGMAAIGGRKRASGTMKGLQSLTDPVENYLEEGARSQVKLYWSAKKYYQGYIYPTNIQIEEVDIQDGSPVRWSCNFTADGLFTAGTDA